MRDLKVQATAWVPVDLPANCDLAPGEELVALHECTREDWHYQRLVIKRDQEPFCYLYVDDGSSSWVLGVFDTTGQAEFFLALHNANPLFVPALLQESSAPAVKLEQEQLIYPVYTGLYRVGLKSYRVEAVEGQAGTVSAEYIDRYHVELLGQGGEKEVCLLVYSHFDGRLRGCKMC